MTLYSRLGQVEARDFIDRIMPEGYEREQGLGFVGGLSTNKDTKRAVITVASMNGDGVRYADHVIVRFGPLHIDKEFPKGTILVHTETAILRLYPTRHPGVATNLVAGAISAYLEGA